MGGISQGRFRAVYRPKAVRDKINLCIMISTIKMNVPEQVIHLAVHAVLVMLTLLWNVSPNGLTSNNMVPHGQIP